MRHDLLVGSCLVALLLVGCYSRPVQSCVSFDSADVRIGHRFYHGNQGEIAIASIEPGAKCVPGEFQCLLPAKDSNLRLGRIYDYSSSADGESWTQEYAMRCQEVNYKVDKTGACSVINVGPVQEFYFFRVMVKK